MAECKKQQMTFWNSEMLITKKWSFIIIKKVTDVKDVNIEKQSYLMHMALTKARKHMQNTK